MPQVPLWLILTLADACALVTVYMKSERVLIALCCIFKITLAVAYMILFPLVVGIPHDGIGCRYICPFI
jgi:hypothetical protein